jgi:hypothetical protein
MSGSVPSRVAKEMFRSSGRKVESEISGADSSSGTVGNLEPKNLSTKIHISVIQIGGGGDARICTYDYTDPDPTHLSATVNKQRVLLCQIIQFQSKSTGDQGEKMWCTVNATSLYQFDSTTVLQKGPSGPFGRQLRFFTSGVGGRTVDG